MAEFFSEYGLFLLKSLTIVAAIALIMVAAVAIGSRKSREAPSGRVEIRKLNSHFEDLEDALSTALLDPVALKQVMKEKKREHKAERKANKLAAKRARKHRGDGETRLDEHRARVFVLSFDGDIRAAAVDNLREEISAILTTAGAEDEVVVRLESGGGMVTAYGLGASQLDRLRTARVPLTVCVDKVAASGGYMMACVADKLLAAPFAVLGSIGVVAQIPNFHRLLKSHNIDFELLTAGKYKRTLTLFGENTDEGREKFLEDIERIHAQFKQYVDAHRPQLDIDAVATGEIWSGQDALDRKLIDRLMTSDEYLMQACERADVIEVKYKQRKSLAEKLSIGVQHALDGVLLTWLDRLLKSRFSIG